jgi:TP901-1 family phage major tail protein
MAAQKGKDLLLKIGDGAGGFTTLAGLRARALVLNAEAVDVTHAESAGRWRELLEGAGVKRAGLSGAGVFRDQANIAAITSVRWHSISPSKARARSNSRQMRNYLLRTIR